ncbi:transposase-like zinc-binding domain-containing protein [Kamptonema sp. PCC 6506]|uniref:IS1/IS1595 family N-terminal zinc-binding domain-containing protein n=1 Tax=Kamptonema sp. PCC 6506 TaxID=272129 RepID=UPI0001DAC26A|nr:hypothetical protein OSCI_1700005 [Kamptonema sp. PCC 6506]
MGVGELGYDDLRVRAPKNNTSQHAELMQCPECQSTHVNKNGHKKGKQNYTALPDVMRYTRTILQTINV